MASWAALWVWAAVAPADPGLELRWEAPPGCPSAAEVRARVVRLVGEEAARTARLTAQGAVRAEAGKWRLDLVLSGETGGGQRSLTAGRCEELAEAGALVIAIAVDPRAALGGEGVVPTPPDGGGELGDGLAPDGAAGGVPAPPDGAAGGGVVDGTGMPGQIDGIAPGPVGDAEPDGSNQVSGEIGPKGHVTRAREVLRVGLRFAGGVGFARILPRTGAAVSVTVSVAGRGWRAEVGGLYAPPVPGGDAEIGGLFQLGAAWLRGCPAWSRGRFEVPVCLGLQVGAIRGRGRGSLLESKQTAHALWLAGTLGAALAWRPHARIGLWLQADAVVALTRPTFVTAGGRPVHESARVGGQALVGLEIRLR